MTWEKDQIAATIARDHEVVRTAANELLVSLRKPRMPVRQRALIAGMFATVVMCLATTVADKNSRYRSRNFSLATTTTYLRTSSTIPDMDTHAANMLRQILPALAELQRASDRGSEGAEVVLERIQEYLQHESGAK